MYVEELLYDFEKIVAQGKSEEQVMSLMYDNGMGMAGLDENLIWL